jgi:predicted MPP superfamily phosphohydrolase
MDIRTKRLIFNGPVFTIIYGLFTFLVFTLVSALFDGAGNSLIIPLTIAISGIYLIATVIQSIKKNPITSFFAVISEIWKGSIVYFILFTTPIFLIKLFVDIPPEIIIILLLGIVPLIIIYSVYNADKVRVRNIDLHFENLTDSVRFAHISDAHIGSIRGNRLLKNIVKKLNDPANGNIDFLVITGDLADGSSKIDLKSFETLRRSNIPMFFTPGNHDFFPGLSNVISAADNANITTLSNKMIEIKGIQVIGIPFAQHNFRDYDFSKNSFNFDTLDSDKSSILLHHVPVGWEFFKSNGVDLVLSGHTHGGQLFPFNYLVKRVYPYFRGLFEDDGKYLYVTEGVGTLTPPMRLGTIAEMVIFDLKKKN